ncbi:DUF1048 domain-containing protein [Lentilactobacillus senioris]|uniref:DUF1048 domain-containing protein n=1 Tax=Lentilactobacillus senioris TaxID=931534 RepID=UPI0006D04694|nr:DUF1048 domain-containing protein [Lentilactobacillus senioris]
MFKKEYWNLKALHQKKLQYQAAMDRVKQLPPDYQQAFQQISDYLMANYGGFDGFDLMDAQVNLIDLFSEVAAQQTPPVAEFIGPDIAAFAHDWGESMNVPNWTENYQQKKQAKINQRINKKLGGGK